MRCLIVDDHAVVRKGIIEIVTDYSPHVTCDEAENAEDARRLFQCEDYDFVLLDISLPDDNGLEVLKTFSSMRPDIPVLILSMHPEEDYAHQAFKLGAKGYLMKNTAPEELVTAIGVIKSGDKFVSPSLAHTLAREQSRPKAAKPPSALSEREYQVIRLIARGERLTAIAENLGVSIKTVSTFRSRAMKKLGLNNTAELIRYAITHGIAES